MAIRNHAFRIAVRQFGPFESAIAKQWAIFDQQRKSGLELEAVPFDLNSLHESLFANNGLAKGEWDVAFISTDWLAEAAERKCLMDLSPRVSELPPAGYPTAWSHSLLRLQSTNGRIFGLPYHDGPECLIYRRDLFQSPVERDRFLQIYGTSLQAPKNWADFRRIAEFFTRPEQPLYGTVFAAFPDGHNTVYDFCLQLWSRGGELFDRASHLSLETPVAHTALDYYRSVLNDCKIVHPQSRTFDSVKSGLAFASGQVAMMVNWFGFAAMCETVAESRVKGCVAVAPVPCEGRAGVSLNAYWILAIAGGSSHQPLAYDFLVHCASPQMDKLLTLEGGIGCRRSTWSDEEVNAAIPFYRCLEQLHENARELPALSHWAKLAEVLDDMVLEALNTPTPTAEILRRAQARSDEMLNTVGSS